MSTRLEEILEQKRKQQEKSEINLEVVRQEWISNCLRLVSRVTEWLKPLEDQNYIEIRPETIPIREEQLGDYEVSALRIVFVKSQVLTIRPVGHFILDAQGRVDIGSGSTVLVMLIHRGNDKWEFVKREGRYGKSRTWPFNRDTFEEFLAEFLED